MPDELLLNDRYRLEERLGSGGMAVVYRARDLMLERNVAIKILREHLSSDPAFRDNFRQEAKAAANLSHPNIVTVHDFGLDDGRLFIVMEHVPGLHLKNLLARRGRLPEEEALSLIVQACAGVGYAHRAGLVHCDIKPHNLLITPDKRLKVTDFGIARALASITPDERTDVVWGSPQYFSPEQAAGFAPSPASDVYSLGVIFYEMLTGQLPFNADSATELAEMHRSASPIPPGHYLANLSPTLEQILMKVLSKEPSLRYRTADQLGRVLISFNRQTPLSENGPVQPALEENQTVAAVVPTRAAAPRRSTVTTPGSPRGNERVSNTQPTPAVIAARDDENPWNIDWVTIGLGLLALLAVGGLVPLYIYVFFLYF
jgi:serine/threonine-protein kinase